MAPVHQMLHTTWTWMPIQHHDTRYRQAIASQELLSSQRFCWEFWLLVEWEKHPDMEKPLAYEQMGVYRQIDKYINKFEYPLANCITWQWNIPMFKRKHIFKGSISIAMLVYRSVNRWIHQERNTVPFVTRVWFCLNMGRIPFPDPPKTPGVSRPQIAVSERVPIFFNDNWIIWPKWCNNKMMQKQKGMIKSILSGQME